MGETPFAFPKLSLVLDRSNLITYIGIDSCLARHVVYYIYLFISLKYVHGEMTGKIKDGSNGDVAIDSFHRYKVYKIVISMYYELYTIFFNCL